MSITGATKANEDTAQASPTLADLDASAGLYESGPDDTVAVRYRSDAELLAAMQRRRSEPPAD